MTVTNIEQQKHHPERYSVWIDGEFAFGLILADIQYFKLEEGKKISEEKYEFIVESLVYIKAQDAALKYLAYRLRSEKEIKEKLREADYGSDVIERVLAFLRKYDYVNDRDYCDRYIRESMNLRPKGSHLLRYELRQKGISDTLIDVALEESGLDEVEGAMRLLEKKLKDVSDIPEKDYRRAVSMLQRRGYSYDIIKEAFFQIKQEQEY